MRDVLEVEIPVIDIVTSDGSLSVLPKKKNNYEKIKACLLDITLCGGSAGVIATGLLGWMYQPVFFSALALVAMGIFAPFWKEERKAASAPHQLLWILLFCISMAGMFRANRLIYDHDQIVADGFNHAIPHVLSWSVGTRMNLTIGDYKFQVGHNHFGQSLGNVMVVADGPTQMIGQSCPTTPESLANWGHETGLHIQPGENGTITIDSLPHGSVTLIDLGIAQDGLYKGWHIASVTTSEDAMGSLCGATKVIVQSDVMSQMAIAMETGETPKEMNQEHIRQQEADEKASRDSLLGINKATSSMRNP
jgi:hypothetical protein